MTDLPLARAVLRRGDWSGSAADRVALDYEGRFLRRRRLEGQAGLAFLVDLPETLSLGDGDAFRLDDGRLVAVDAAPEALLRLSSPDLARLAWHVGNRHTPCAIGADHLLIRHDHVLAAMARQLGAGVTEVTAPFTPEGGAYGHGRTLGHAHSHDHAHDHPHDHHGHDHGHGHHAEHGHGPSRERHDGHRHD